jgi:hypothetical protein
MKNCAKTKVQFAKEEAVSKPARHQLLTRSSQIEKVRKHRWCYPKEDSEQVKKTDPNHPAKSPETLVNRRTEGETLLTNPTQIEIKRGNASNESHHTNEEQYKYERGKKMPSENQRNKKHKRSQ